MQLPDLLVELARLVAHAQVSAWAITRRDRAGPEIGTIQGVRGRGYPHRPLGRVGGPDPARAHVARPRLGDVVGRGADEGRGVALAARLRDDVARSVPPELLGPTAVMALAVDRKGARDGVRRVIESDSARSLHRRILPVRGVVPVERPLSQVAVVLVVGKVRRAGNVEVVNASDPQRGHDAHGIRVEVAVVRVAQLVLAAHQELERGVVGIEKEVAHGVRGVRGKRADSPPVPIHVAVVEDLAARRRAGPHQFEAAVARGCHPGGLVVGPLLQMHRVPQSGVEADGNGPGAACNDVVGTIVDVEDL
mmetsp:Transcript_48895/g.148790  ORF Transcript_48895/g.148790 Transcript_48895/m.148790 type:complete len:307 (+) Transcript_48895:8696-9616(+)